MARISLNPSHFKKDLLLLLKLHFGLIGVVVTSVLFFSQEALSNASESPLVEVEVRGDVVADYKARRADSGIYIGLQKEDVSFDNYVSFLDSKSYINLFGEEPITLALLTINYKLNYSLGSLAIGLEGGKGGIKDNLSGQDRRLDISKYGLNLKLTADMILDEPFIAPYLGLTMWQMEVEEQSPAEVFSATTQMGMNYTAGLLIQLNWIDKASAIASAFNWGLENTFVDLYITQYGKTAAIDDPDTETGATYGAGLRLEF